MLKKIFLQSVVLLVGTGLILYHLKYNIGITFMFAGIYFVYVGLMTVLIDIGHATTGTLKKILQSKILWAILILGFGALLLSTVVVGLITSHIIIVD